MGSELQVKEVMVQKPVSIDEEELATKARSILREYGYRILPVVKGGKLVGVITDRDILNITSARSNILVKGLMSLPMVYAHPEEEALGLGEKLITSVIENAAVVDEDMNLVGMVSIHDILAGLKKKGRKLQKKRVEEIISRAVITCSPDEKVSKSWTKMEETGFTGMPVVKGNRLVGMITRKDIIKSGFARIKREDEKGKVKKTPSVEKVMHTPAISIAPSAMIQEVMELMLEHGIGRLPVVVKKGNKEQLVGIIDRTDILKTYLI